MSAASCWRVAMCILSLLVCLLVPSVARADGLIIIHEPPVVIPGHFTFAPLEVRFHRVDVEINDQVAVTSIDQEFYNPNHSRLEGTYMFPLPAGAHIDKFAMDVDGKMTEAELLSADKARAIYEDIVRRQKDPALLEYVGRDAFKVRIFPIEPHAGKRIKIRYTQLLKSDSGLVEYLYPLNTEKFSSRPLNDVSVRVKLVCKEPIKSLYSPTHNVEIKRDGDRRATIGYEERNVRPDTDFKLIFSRKKDPIGIDLLTYRDGDEDDGYFVLMASPGMDVPREMIQPKDICFVLDTSGSMAGAKMEQAKKALEFCLANLNEKDRFEIIRFSTEAENLFGTLKDAGADNIAKARAFVKELKPIGGTAIDQALGKSLRLQADKPRTDVDARPYLVIFLTDGLPTVGETSEDAIVARVTKTGEELRASTRIFSFGIGQDVNTHLLDRIASETRAASQYVLPDEDLEVKLSNFYTKIKEPVLSNIEVTFSGEGARTSRIYPSVMPDLFKGDMLVLFGRYSLDARKRAAGAVKITGTLNGEKREFAQDVSFAEHDTSQEFIPRLWATRRVGWLLDEIRLHGESGELKDEVTRLARQYGIVTPYTAYLILEDEARRDVPVTLRNFREMERDREVSERAGAAYKSLPAEAGAERLRSGGQAVLNAQRSADLKGSWHVGQSVQTEALAKAPATAGPPGMATTQPQLGYRVAQNYAQQARVVNGRAFYQNGSTWTDSTAQSQRNLKQRQVRFNSDEYFALLRQHPNAAGWLALGNEVDVVLGDTLYQIR